MKKIYKIFAIIAVSAFAFSSCEQEQVTDTPTIVNEEETGILVSITTGEPVSKTMMSGSTPYWCDGDAIGVSNQTKDNNKQFSENSIAAGLTATTATFGGSVAATGTYYAYYPYTSNGVGTSGAKVDIPSTQHPTLTSFDGSADVMVSKSFTISSTEATTIKNLEFARLGAIVKVVLIDNAASHDLSTEELNSVSITAPENIVGRVYIDMVNQELGELYHGQSKTVTAEYSSDKFAINGTNGAYFVVYPQTLAAGETLTVSAVTDNYEISKDITIPAGGIVFEGGSVTVLKISLADGNIAAVSAGDALPFEDDMSWADNGASDSNTNIASTVATESSDMYVSATYLYKGIGGAKLGSGSNAGSITTKELDLSGAFYIAIEAGQYGTDTGNIEVSIDGEDAVIESNDFSDVLYANIAAGTYTNKSKVTIATSAKRGRVYSVEIKSGTYVPKPRINVTSSNPMNVSNANDLYAIEYTIVNPSGASISASSNVAWIHGFDYSVAGEVSFEVDAQTAGDPERSGNITLSYTGASNVVVEVNQAAGDGGKAWRLVTDASSLAIGDEIIIVNNDYTYAAKRNSGGNNMLQTAVTSSDSGVTLASVPGDIAIITLGKDSGKWTFSVDTDVYLYAAGGTGKSPKNHLKEISTLDQKARWTISISSNIATIVVEGGATRNTIMYNSTNGIFSCYASGTQSDVRIYRYE